MRKIIANIAFLFLLNACCDTVYAQDSAAVNRYNNLYKSFQKTEILTGISWQGNWKDEDRMLRYGELGVARSVHYDGRHGPVSFGVFLSEEFYFGSQNIYGTKVGIYTHYLLDIGLSLIYYTDFKRGNFKVRPVMGIGMGSFRAIVGINIPTIDNRTFAVLKNKNSQISIQYLLPVKKKEIKREENIFKALLKK